MHDQSSCCDSGRALLARRRHRRPICRRKSTPRRQRSPIPATAGPGPMSAVRPAPGRPVQTGKHSVSSWVWCRIAIGARFLGTVQGLDSTGPQFGGYVGYNLEVGSRAVLGLEGDINWGHTKGSLVGGFPGLGGPPDTSVNDHGFVSTGWNASIRGRAGFLLVPSLLVYATGGVAFQQFGFNANCPATDGGGWCDLDHNETVSTTRTGYTAGFGIEQAFGRMDV